MGPNSYRALIAVFKENKLGLIIKEIPLLWIQVYVGSSLYPVLYTEHLREPVTFQKRFVSDFQGTSRAR